MSAIGVHVTLEAALRCTACRRPITSRSGNAAQALDGFRLGSNSSDIVQCRGFLT